ncbi:MAG: hypothetical protein WCA35_30805 [Kovacikia sp.]
MQQRRYYRKPETDSNPDYSATQSRHERTRTLRERLSHERIEPRNSERFNSAHPSLTHLIERDAPLQANSVLVLMYGPFQAEMVPQEGQGVASWLKECVRKHGIPSLVRFDYRHRAQIYRRDQFQTWLEPLISKVSS